MNFFTQSLPSKFKNNTFKTQTVGTSAVQITQPGANDEVGTKALNNIFVQAPSQNTGRITLKNKSDVTDGGAGFELTAGQNINLPSNNPSEWYVIASAAAQKITIVYSNAPV